MSNSNNGHDIEVKSTPAATWRRERIQGYPVTLPSGNIAILQNVPLDQLLESGDIPDILTPIASRALWSDTDSNELAKDVELHRKFMDLIGIIIPMSMISPKVVLNPNPEKEEISLDDIDFNDKVAIFNLAIQPAAVLKNFRKVQEKSMADSSDSQDLRDSAVEDS
jgi:hypothetical protein